MKITKYVHSCLLLNEQGKTVLIDPGSYSESALPVDELAALDAIIYTHEHQDHFYPPLLKKLVEKFPDVVVVANDSIKALIKKEGIAANFMIPDFVSEETAKHEQMLKFPVCQNVSYTLFNILTHPGDSLSFSKTARVLALPVQAPWGSTSWAMEKAEEAKPEVILPIHDWHWRDEAREWMYTRLVDYCKDLGMVFIPLETGKTVEL